MRTYILRRVLQSVPLLLGISALTFILLQLAPGDFLNIMRANPNVSQEALEAMARQFGLDRPWWVQYGLYLKNIFLHFNFGESFARHQPVFVVLREGMVNTLILASAAALVSWDLADYLPLAHPRRQRVREALARATATAASWLGLEPPVQRWADALIPELGPRSRRVDAAAGVFLLTASGSGSYTAPSFL